jgi:coenzyme F420-reducing hydrogenase beta subunit
MKSSSGGLFTLLAEEVLEEGGYVCGVVLDEEFSAVHRIVHTKEELAAIRGSKYIQSRTELIFRDIKKLLDQGKTVLFGGVPCQCAGLKGFLGKAYDNLLTVDVVCHGVPSPGVFQKYRQETYGSKLADFQFRTKEFGHNCNHCIATLKNGKRIVGNQANDPYERAFHTSLMLRTSCGNCTFAPTPRQGDVTLGDFWHLGKYDPSYPDEKGVSLVLLNTEKGEAIWEKIKDRLSFAEPVPLEFTLKHNRFRSKITIPEGRDRFFEENKKQTFKKAVEIASGERFSRKAALRQWLKRVMPEGLIRLLKKAIR